MPALFLWGSPLRVGRTRKRPAYFMCCLITYRSERAAGDSG